MFVRLFFFISIHLKIRAPYFSLIDLQLFFSQLLSIKTEYLLQGEFSIKALCYI